MNKYIVNIPEGYELDEEKSNFVFKKKTPELPKSVEEIPNRNWYVSNWGAIRNRDSENDIDQVSSKERAEAFLALMQLVELRDAWNKASEESWKDLVYVIVVDNDSDSIEKEVRAAIIQQVLSFKTPELRDQFYEEFKDLIETAKELI